MDSRSGWRRVRGSREGDGGIGKPAESAAPRQRLGKETHLNNVAASNRSLLKSKRGNPAAKRVTDPASGASAGDKSAQRRLAGCCMSCPRERRELH